MKWLIVARTLAGTLAPKLRSNAGSKLVVAVLLVVAAMVALGVLPIGAVLPLLDALWPGLLGAGN